MSRILLLLRNEGNRKLLGEWISQRTEHDVVSFDTEDLFASPFDLCIVDGPGLGDFRSDLARYRMRAEPEFVPVLLLVPSEYARRLNDDVWDDIDDIIWTSLGDRSDSLDTFELAGRIRSLLRTRSMSQTLLEDQQRLKVLHRVLRHNLRNSLNVVRGAAEELGDFGGEDHVDLIFEESANLISHSEKAEDIEMILEDGSDHTIDLGNRVREIVEQFDEVYPPAEITLEVNASVQVTVIVGITRAIGELIDNTITHAASDTPTVDVEVDRVDGYGVVSVTDSAPTISEQDRRVLRGDLEPTSLNHGSGVGLWLIVWTVRRSNGQVQYHDLEHGGNRIELRLPATSLE